MVAATPPHPSDPVLLVTVDTEEDQWGPDPGGYTVDNIRLLPMLHRVFGDLGLRATYFTTWQVANCGFASDIVAHLARTQGADIEAHLHPWCTPPLQEPATGRNTMMGNLPYELQEAKIRVLTDSLTRVLGGRPTIFRAGRLGLGPRTVEALVSCGYEVDCSVAPFTDFTEMDEGPDFTNAPLDIHRIAPAEGLTSLVDADLMEIPVSVGFTRRPFAFWGRVHRACERVRIGGVPLSGLLSRSGVVRKVALEPEIDTARDMTRVALELIRSGVGHLQLLMHSPSLVPGLTPFARSEADVQRLLRKIGTFVTELRRHVDVRAATVKEFADELMARDAS